MTTVEEVMQLCRLCLVKDKVNVPIFEEDVEIRQILTKINTLLPVKVSRNDNLPKLICKDCSSKLDMLYMFRKTSVESDKQLHSWLSSGPKETKPEVSVKQENFESTESRIEDEQVDAAAFLMQQEFEELDESGLEQESVRKKFKRTPKSAVETDDEDFDEGMAAKPEDDDSDEMDQTDYAEDPSVGTDDEQPGPSGVVKEATETPFQDGLYLVNIKWTCQKCFSKFQTSDLLQQHMKLVHQDTQKFFEVRQDMSRFIGREWECKKCSVRLETRSLLKEHKKTAHPKILVERKYFCYISNDKQYLCNICSQKFHSEIDVERHIADQHSPSYVCSICVLSFPNPIKYAFHMQEHNEQKVISCPVCSFNARFKVIMASHIEVVHFGTYPFHCNTCGKGFKEENVLKEHELQHLGMKGFECVVCSKTFMYSKAMWKHQIENHVVCSEGEFKNNQCHVCRRVFATVAKVQKHMTTAHAKTKLARRTHLCDTCGKTFAQPGQLESHRNLKHTGIRKYMCHFCNKGFTAKRYLTVHEVIHAVNKPYSCKTCGKSFTQKSPLTIHERIHTGEKPYICMICKKGCISRSALNCHLKTCSKK